VDIDMMMDTAVVVCMYPHLIIIIIMQHLYSAMTSLQDTEALVAPARSVGTGGF